MDLFLAYNTIRHSHFINTYSRRLSRFSAWFGDLHKEGCCVKKEHTAYICNANLLIYLLNMEDEQNILLFPVLIPKWRETGALLFLNLDTNFG